MDTVRPLGALTPDRPGLAEVLRRRTFRRGEALFHEGDPGDALFIVERGKVAITRTTELGDVVTLTILGRGATFGEQALVGPEATRTAGAVALEQVEVRVLHRRDFDDLRARDPGVDSVLVDILAAQVRRLSAQLQDALFVSADRRIMRRLGDLVALYRTVPGPVEIPLRQDDLATMAGTTRPTVNRLLRQLERDGLVTLRRGHVSVDDPVALAHRAR